MQHSPPWYAHIDWRAVLVIVLFVGGIFAWLAWRIPDELTIFLYGIGVLILAALSAWLFAPLVVYLRRNKPELLRADKVIAHAEAQRTLPIGVQTVSWHDSSRPLPAALTSSQLLRLVSAPPSVPTFGQLLDQGQIGPGRPLILGYVADSGQAITGDWNTLFSCGVGGMTGSGKSWVIAFLAGQSAAAGARIILIDPHAGDPESLANRLAGLSASFMCDVASSPSAIESALKLASSKLDNRRAGRGGTWPMLLICDEWTSMLRGKLGDLLTATALDFAEQGRKYGCFGILGAQAWQVDAAGAVRDRLASHYILRTRGDQFRYQTGLRSGAAPEDTLTLPPGQAYLLSTRGDLQKVQIPQMTHADILRLGTLVDAPARSPAKFGFIAPTAPLTPIVASAKPERSQKVAARTSATTAHNRLQPLRRKPYTRQVSLWPESRQLRLSRSYAVSTLPMAAGTNRRSRDNRTYPTGGAIVTTKTTTRLRLSLCDRWRIHAARYHSAAVGVAIIAILLYARILLNGRAAPEATTAQPAPAVAPIILIATAPAVVPPTAVPAVPQVIFIALPTSPPQVIYIEVPAPPAGCGLHRSVGRGHA